MTVWNIYTTINNLIDANTVSQDQVEAEIPGYIRDKWTGDTLIRYARNHRLSFTWLTDGEIDPINAAACAGINSRIALDAYNRSIGDGVKPNYDMYNGGRARGGASADAIAAALVIVLVIIIVIVFVLAACALTAPAQKSNFLWGGCADNNDCSPGEQCIWEGSGGYCN